MLTASPAEPPESPVAPAASGEPDTATLRKARGAFFTPEEIARYVTAWAIRSPDDLVLEPSCGEAAFLLAAGDRLRRLGAPAGTPRLHGVELHEASAATARGLLAAAGLPADVRVGDFFLTPPTPRFDAVVGNPPYVRYQDFGGAARAASRAAALRAGVRLSSLASSWAAFTVHAALSVRPGGRLGLVLPAELLTVNYAAPVREFLMGAFARVRLVLFTERVFPGVLEEVVLLLAEGRDAGPTDHCELLQARNAAALAELTEPDVTRWWPGADARWSGVHLRPAQADAYASALRGDAFAPLLHWGETTLGMVTGANRFFALSPAQARDRGIPTEELLPLSPPGSRHLRSLRLGADTLEALGAAGGRTLLFRPGGTPSVASARYIAQGERERVDAAYKCRIRSPWWRVPYVPPADLLLTYMNADTARLCGNAARAHHLNSVHGVYLRDDVRALGATALPVASLNSVTLLGAELVGRAYGGGILKLEPREADRWPMPSPALVQAAAPDLSTVEEEVRGFVGRGRIGDAARLVDDVLAAHGSGLGPGQLDVLREAREGLHRRRSARGRSR